MRRKKSIVNSAANLSGIATLVLLIFVFAAFFKHLSSVELENWSALLALPAFGAALFVRSRVESFLIKRKKKD